MWKYCCISSEAMLIKLAQYSYIIIFSHHLDQENLCFQETNCVCEVSSFWEDACFLSLRTSQRYVPIRQVTWWGTPLCVYTSLCNQLFKITKLNSHEFPTTLPFSSHLAGPELVWIHHIQQLHVQKRPSTHIHNYKNCQTIYRHSFSRNHLFLPGFHSEVFTVELWGHRAPHLRVQTVQVGISYISSPLSSSE